MSKIVCLSGANADYEYELPDDGDFEVTFGRSDENDICVMDRKSSRFHCKLIFENDSIVLKDLESTNGVYLNDTPVAGEAPVDFGDFISIGETVFTLMHDSTGSASGEINRNQQSQQIDFSKNNIEETQRFEVTKTTTFRKMKTEQTGCQTGFLSFFEKKSKKTH